MYNDMLPIGTIVNLINFPHKLVIIGYSDESSKSKDVLYKYVACLYPYGFMDRKNIYTFENKDIKQLVYLGLKDEKFVEFKNELNIIMGGK